MAYLTTGLDLKTDALSLAGEPSDGTSQYDGDVYEWLTVVQRALVSGGSLGGATIAPMDWPWARAPRPGVVTLGLAVNADAAATATLIESSTAVFLSAAPTEDLVGMRFVAPRTATSDAFFIVRQTGTILVLDTEWPGASVLDTTWRAYPEDYALPADFVRGCSPLSVGGTPYQLDVLDPAALALLYPVALATTGVPAVAARVGEQRLRFSHWLDTDATPLRIEFAYVRQPDVMTAGTVPVLPVAHRRVLSYGAAYLILDDKDDTGAEGMYAKFLSQWRAMADEYRRGMRRMSARWGQPQPSMAMTGARQPPYLTSSGLAVWW